MRASLFVLVSVLLMSAFAQTTPRASRPQFKGVELYSWQQRNIWYFSLLTGTNRNKTLKEIKATPSTIRGVPALKQHLSQLAVGEQVTWSLPPQMPLAYPSRAVIDDIVHFAAALQITVQIPQK